MHFSIVMYLALSTLGGFVLSVPLPKIHHMLKLKDMEVIRSPEFQDAAENALSLITKILSEIPAVHKSLISFTTLSLDESDLSTLQFLKQSLDLPEPRPLQPFSHNFKLDDFLAHMVEGLQLHKTVLKVISELRSKNPNDLLYDLRDVLLHLHTMQHLINAPKGAEKVTESQLRTDLAPKLEIEYDSQVAAHLALIQLRDFSRDVSNSLQSMIMEPGDGTVGVFLDITH